MKGDIVEDYQRRFALTDKATELEQRAEAVVKAVALRKRMKRPGDWRIRVHQNLGWFYSIFRQSDVATISVSPSYGGGYSAMLGHGQHAGGCSPIYWSDPYNKRHRDPNKAVAHALKLAREHVDEVTAAVVSQERMQPCDRLKR